jgi:uncharacterized protein YjeT (DUF2065 family)
MAHKKTFRIALAILLVVIAAGIAWMAVPHSWTRTVQPVVEARSNIVEGKVAWDCPGCPPH